LKDHVNTTKKVVGRWEGNRWEGGEEEGYEEVGRKER
jgi:hypothetical protein